MVILMYTKLEPTYEKRHDTFRVIFIFIVSAILAGFTTYDWSVRAVAWTFSLWVETVAIIPQMLLLVRSKHVDVLSREHVFFLSVYRIFYMLNWVATLVKMRSSTTRVLWITGIIQTLVYSDFIFHYIKLKVSGHDELLPL
jgi:ER lumen protein retaining receptor